MQNVSQYFFKVLVHEDNHVLIYCKINTGLPEPNFQNYILIKQFAMQRHTFMAKRHNLVTINLKTQIFIQSTFHPDPEICTW